MPGTCLGAAYQGAALTLPLYTTFLLSGIQVWRQTIQKSVRKGFVLARSIKVDATQSLILFELTIDFISNKLHPRFILWIYFLALPAPSEQFLAI